MITQSNFALLTNKLLLDAPDSHQTRTFRIPTPEHDMISAAAQLLSVQMGLTVGVIKQIPNQPIVFKVSGHSYR